MFGMIRMLKRLYRLQRCREKILAENKEKFMVFDKGFEIIYYNKDKEIFELYTTTTILTGSRPVRFEKLKL